jgi:hypothetical protein
MIQILATSWGGSHRERPWRFWISVTITAFLLLVALAFLICLIADTL